MPLLSDGNPSNNQDCRPKLPSSAFASNLTVVTGTSPGMTAASKSWKSTITKQDNMSAKPPRSGAQNQNNAINMDSEGFMLQYDAHKKFKRKMVVGHMRKV